MSSSYLLALCSDFELLAFLTALEFFLFLNPVVLGYSIKLKEAQLEKRPQTKVQNIIKFAMHYNSVQNILKYFIRSTTGCRVKERKHFKNVYYEFS